MLSDKATIWTMRNWLGRTAVGALLYPVCPSAIVETVGTIVIDAVERKAGRWFAHVGVEALKYQPSFADSNATPTVVSPCWTTRIAASRDHRTPNGVDFCMSLAVSSTAAPVLAASAGLGVSACEVHTNNIDNGAALATAPPAQLALMARYRDERRKIAEPLIGEIAASIHRKILNALINAVKAAR